MFGYWKFLSIRSEGRNNLLLQGSLLCRPRQPTISYTTVQDISKLKNIRTSSVLSSILVRNCVTAHKSNVELQVASFCSYMAPQSLPGSVVNARLRGGRSIAPPPREYSSGPPSGSEYEQGQSPGPRLREYFYYIDHQGMLFLDDARMKNFTSCFKDTKFLDFFFRRVRINESERYPEFPYVSLCGREMNYIRCDDVPIVFTHMFPSSSPPTASVDQQTVPGHSSDGSYTLRYNHGGDGMRDVFQPSKVLMEPATGRIYHPAPDRLRDITPVALVHTKLALLLANHFTFPEEEESSGGPIAPSHLQWGAECIPLDQSLLPALRGMQDLRRHSLGIHQQLQ